jgi:transposase InsO family protein
MPQPPRMANLPKERLQGFVRVFTNVGLDCFGPFHVVIGRKTVKRYGLLITCLASRAVHLEVLDSMDADSFIMALRRFISYRGCPKVIYSDNGTNIVAGQKELEQGIANLNSTRVVGEMVDAGIDWWKSAPSCAHEGGVWERLIGSSKVAMRAILESRSINDEVLRTVFAEVTSFLNSRPLTHFHTDPSEPEPLTPNHFLIGGPHPHRVPDEEQAFDGVTRRRWKQSQFIVNQFWRRWMREYLPSLMERKKWEKSVRPLRVGDKVLIMDENLKRGEWLTGSIIAVHPGDDGVIRKATVQTARSTLLRPAVKLCFISGDRSG